MRQRLRLVEGSVTTRGGSRGKRAVKRRGPTYPTISWACSVTLQSSSSLDSFLRSRSLPSPTLPYIHSRLRPDTGLTLWTWLSCRHPCTGTPSSRP